MFTITARAVLELGSELISSDIIAFYELIKNGFDAGTKTGIDIHFNIVLRRNSYLLLRQKAERTKRDDAAALVAEATESLATDAEVGALVEAKDLLAKSVSSRADFLRALDKVYSLSTIVISDTGSGMTRQNLVQNFLVIGTSSRKKDVDAALQRGDEKSPFLGEKGIGRLSAMRLGESLRVETAQKDDASLNELVIDWTKFSNVDAMLSDIKIKPTSGASKPTTTWSGTRIIIGLLAEDWTATRVQRMAEYDFARLTDPFYDARRRPRIALFWNGDRVSIPSMDKALLDNSHAAVSGTFSIEDGEPVLRCALIAKNLGFEHPVESESSTVTKSDLTAALVGVNKQLPASAITDIGPFKFEIYWFNRRLLRSIDGIGDLKVIRELQERWSGIMLFRDGFRVFPYGDDEDDWLGLDRKALRRSGYTLNKTQFVGHVEISRVKNPSLLDQTNREGLRESPEQHILIELMQYVIQDQLFRFMKHVERQYKGQKVDLVSAKKRVDELNARSKAAIAKLRRLAPTGSQDVDTLQQALIEFSDFADTARLRIEEVEQESRQMIDMAGVGLMVEVVAHELARTSENALETIDDLRGRAMPDEVKLKLASLRAQMKSLSKRIRVLDPLSVSGRQTTEVFDLGELVDEIVEAHEGQFGRHRIKVIHKKDDGPLKVKAVKGMVVQIIENLISNSKYWLEVRALREPSRQAKILISTSSRPPTIVYEDNGPGISVENQEKVFRAFYSLKEKSQRRGLGLFIARACATQLGGTLVLDDYVSQDNSRLNRFVLELPGSSAVK